MPIEAFYFLIEDRELQKQIERIKGQEGVKIIEGEVRWIEKEK